MPNHIIMIQSVISVQFILRSVRHTTINCIVWKCKSASSHFTFLISLVAFDNQIPTRVVPWSNIHSFIHLVRRLCKSVQNLSAKVQSLAMNGYVQPCLVGRIFVET